MKARLTRSLLGDLCRLAAATVAAAVFWGADGGPAAAQADRTGAIAGVVDDVSTGLPVAGAAVATVGRDRRVVSAADGRFVLSGVEPGFYRLAVERAGYQPVQSGDIAVVAGATTSVTLALERERAAGRIAPIGSTATHASQALLRSTTTTQTLTTDALAQRGVERIGDGLRTLPGAVNGVGGDTAALSDDVSISLRGIGTLETAAAIDGHPIAYGFPGGYNFQLSPLAPFRDVVVTYGSGSNLLGTSAIGGVVDMRTLEPTAERRFTLEQGLGTWNASATTLRATGTAGRLGYVFGYGVTGVDGALRKGSPYEPGAAFDVSAPPGSPVHALAVYPQDAAAGGHSGLAKLRWSLSPQDAIVATAVGAAYYEDKTGNGDGDYLGPSIALLQGQALAAAGSNGCAAGTIAIAHGGKGPGGTPDGGSPCVTAAQWAADNAGWQGNGPAYQTLSAFDGSVAFEHASASRIARAGVYTNRYESLPSRYFRLPFTSAPGDRFSYTDNRERETGAFASEDFVGANNTVGLTYAYVNAAFYLQRSTSAGTSVGTPAAHEQTYGLRDVYHVPGSPLSVFANLAFDAASATHASAVDPRVSVRYAALGTHDVVRLSAGATTTQPAGNQLGVPFAGVLLNPGQQAGGGGQLQCGGLTSIGNVPSSALRPERGVDTELAYAHGFRGDAYVSLDVYSARVYDKLYSALVPLGATGGAFVPSAVIANDLSVLTNACPGSTAANLGLTGTFNIGSLRARGALVSGRARIDRRTFADYAWSLDSTAVVDVPVDFLKNNPTLIPGSQLVVGGVSLPLHTYDVALDRRFGDVDVRAALHGVSAENTKRLPAYTVTDLRVAAPLARASVTLSVSNLFNQWADPRGLLYEGERYALNAYAPASAYGPLGSAASERYGLPPRTLFVDVSVPLR